MEATPEEIAQVEGIGPVIAEAVAAWLVDQENLAVVEGLRDGRRDAERPGARRGGAARGR